MDPISANTWLIFGYLIFCWVCKESIWIPNSRYAFIPNNDVNVFIANDYELYERSELNK